jgi:hypothetical protein
MVVVFRVKAVYIGPPGPSDSFFYSRQPLFILMLGLRARLLRKRAGLAQREHPLEFLPGEAKKQGHLFELLSPSIILWSGAKSFDPRGEIYALHLFGSRVPIQTAAILLSEHTKLT